MFLHSAEDYYERFPLATFMRLMRVLLSIVALLGPSMWIAINTYHQEMLPTSLLLTVAASRVGIPFPAVAEGFLMEVFFEVLREAGVRMPRQMGQAVSIVGALVIGQAAVQAGLVSAPQVIVVAATGIASFAIPHYSFGVALRLARFSMMVLAGALGLYGVLLGMLFMLFHLAALRSLGVPYLQPMAPLTVSELKDAIVLAPRWLQNRRPASLNVLNPRRLSPGQGPRTPRGGETP